MSIARKLVVLLLAAQLLACAAVMTHLPMVIAAVTDGSMVLDAVESFVKKSPAVLADEARRAQVETALAAARAALSVALRLAQGVRAMDQAQVDEAFRDFRLAYAALLQLVGPLGVKTSGGNLMAVSPGMLLVPEPLAFRVRLP